MKTYYISKDAHIDNPFFLVFANVVDEKIVTQTLNDNGYYAIQTGASDESADRNFREHIDVIYKDEHSKNHYVDVKTSGEKYITLSKTLLKTNPDNNDEFAIIYDDRIYFARTKDVLQYAKKSKYNDMMYVTVGEFMGETMFVIKIDKQLQEYREKQYALKDELLNETKRLSKKQAIETVADALQYNYQKTFGDSFEIAMI